MGVVLFAPATLVLLSGRRRAWAPAALGLFVFVLAGVFFRETQGAMGVERQRLPSWDDLQFVTAQMATKPLLDERINAVMDLLQADQSDAPCETFSAALTSLAG